MKISKDIRYVGVNDHKIDLFEGQYMVPNGMAYNSYVILDEKIAVMDSVDQHFGDEWLKNLEEVLEGRKPDYLIVQHMEPDHSANIAKFMKAYPEAFVIASRMAFTMMKGYFGEDYADRRIAVGEGDKLSLGNHKLTFVTAPMVHWPEVIMTYDSTEKVLFSADAFGKFGALDVEEDWACEARRYYIGIVGKYGQQVQALLAKAAGLDIQMICPLHGPVLTDNLGYYINLYDIWSSYRPEDEGVLIAYTSIYGHTKEAVDLLAEKLKEKGCPKVTVADLARDDMAEAVEDAFRYSKMVLATTTYNADIFPYMKEFIHHLTERNYQSRMVGLIESGSWAPQAAKVMKKMLEESQNLTFTDTTVRILCAMNDENKMQIEDLAEELVRKSADHSAAKEEYLGSETAQTEMSVDEIKENWRNFDVKALYNISYGLYVITSTDGKKDNGMIGNAVVQITNKPARMIVGINKSNYSHDVIKETGIMNVNCLSVDAPFSVIEKFGFQSGRDTDKFAGEKVTRSENGLAVMDQYANAVLSLKVESYIDMDSHGMFICSVEEEKVLTDKESMSYTYYQNNVKPKANAGGDKKKGFVCKICGWVYEGDTLPADLVCPLCKHPAEDFEPLA